MFPKLPRWKLNKKLGKCWLFRKVHKTGAINLQIELKNGIHLAFGIKDKYVFFWDLTSLTYKEKVNVSKGEF